MTASLTERMKMKRYVRTSFAVPSSEVMLLVALKNLTMCSVVKLKSLSVKA
jgi:hypothetical protein